jgi:hypothetical protein
MKHVRGGAAPSVQLAVAANGVAVMAWLETNGTLHAVTFQAAGQSN